MTPDRIKRLNQIIAAAKSPITNHGRAGFSQMMNGLGTYASLKAKYASALLDTHAYRKSAISSETYNSGFRVDLFNAGDADFHRPFSKVVTPTERKRIMDEAARVKLFHENRDFPCASQRRENALNRYFEIKNALADFADQRNQEQEAA